MPIEVGSWRLGERLEGVEFSTLGTESRLEKTLADAGELNGRIEKSFGAHAFHEPDGYVLEVEGGTANVNNQSLKDLFQACMMHRVDYLAVAVQNLYEGEKQKCRDFERVVAFFDTLHASHRVQLPLKGILIIGSNKLRGQTLVD